MPSSQRAPSRIAPRPVCQKYRPLSSELRQGVHEGAGTRALRNSAPSAATRSKCGVLSRLFTSALGPVPWLAYALA